MTKLVVISNTEKALLMWELKQSYSTNLRSKQLSGWGRKARTYFSCFKDCSLSLSRSSNTSQSYQWTDLINKKWMQNAYYYNITALIIIIINKWKNIKINPKVLETTTVLYFYLIKTQYLKAKPVIRNNWTPKKTGFKYKRQSEWISRLQIGYLLIIGFWRSEFA